MSFWCFWISGVVNEFSEKTARVNYHRFSGFQPGTETEIIFLENILHWKHFLLGKHFYLINEQNLKVNKLQDKIECSSFIPQTIWNSFTEHKHGWLDPPTAIEVVRLADHVTNYEKLKPARLTLKPLAMLESRGFLTKYVCIKS